MELGWTVKALAIILKTEKSFESDPTADPLITHEDLITVMPLIQKECPVELGSLFFPLKTPTTKEGADAGKGRWRLLLTLVTNHLYETHSLQETVSSLEPQQQFQCLRLYLRLYGKDLTRDFEESMFDACLKKPANSMVHIIYYLIYQGLLSEECASWTVSEIYKYMEELEEGTLLSILYSLLFYLSQEVLSEQQSGKLSAQIENLLTQLQRKYPRVVGCIAPFVNGQCKTIQLPDSLSSLSEEERAQIKQHALWTILGDCDGLDKSAGWELLRKLEEEGQYFDTCLFDICMFLKQKGLSPENRMNTLVKLFEPKGSIVFPLEVRRQIIILVRALMDTLFHSYSTEYEGDAHRVADDFMTQHPRQFVQIFKLIEKMRVEGTTVDSTLEDIGVIRCPEAIGSALSADKWEGYVEELISRRCYDHLRLQLVFHILLSGLVPPQRRREIVRRNWDLMVYLSALSPGVKSTYDGRSAFSRIIDVMFDPKHGTSSSEASNWLRNLCNKQVACEGEQNALQEQLAFYLEITMQNLDSVLSKSWQMKTHDLFQEKLSECLSCVDYFSLGSVRHIQVLEDALQRVYKVKKRTQQQYAETPCHNK